MRYILASEKEKGTNEIAYLNGVLNLFKLELKETLNDKQLELIIDRLGLANNENDLLAAFKDIGLKPVKQMAGNEKVALWCRLYEVYVGTKYKASRADGGKLKGIYIDEQILFHYFTSQNFLLKNRYSISNLVKYYNELIAEIKNLNRSKHPDQYDPAYEGRLEPKALADYWAHLRSKGFEPKKDRTGRTIDWIRKQTT